MGTCWWRSYWQLGSDTAANTRLMRAGAGSPLGTAPRAVHSRPASGLRVRGYHKELPQRLDGNLLIEELLAAGQ